MQGWVKHLFSSEYKEPASSGLGVTSLKSCKVSGVPVSGGSSGVLVVHLPDWWLHLEITRLARDEIPCTFYFQTPGIITIHLHLEMSSESDQIV